VAGQSPTVLRVAATRADAWNTHGPFGAGLDEIVKITRSQTRQLDELCADAGRDPASLRRSLLLFAALDPWTSDVEPAAVIERFAEQAHIGEFVVFWPGDDRVGDLERLANVIRG
jgi:alkanesulfonate monooxygenase SsuD/methylene tetrahydromethanopterin reductase-like flavin-dependent oxidoreductase (luciferase family)